MQLVTLMTEMFNIIGYPTTIRDGRLEQLCKQYTNEIELLFSVSNCVKTTTTKNIFVNTTISDNDLLLFFLQLVKGDTIVWKQIPVNYRVVLTQLIRGNTFNISIILDNIDKIFTKAELLHKLTEVTNDIVKEKRTPYIIIDGELCFTYRGSGKTTKSNIWLRTERPMVPNNTCVLTTEAGELIGTGGVDLYKYMINAGNLPSVIWEDTVHFAVNKELGKINERARGRTLVLFTDNAPVIKTPNKLEYNGVAVDWLVNDNYEPIGFIVEIEGMLMRVQHKIKKYWVAAGLENLILKIVYKNKPRVSNVELVDVIMEEEGDV